MTSEKFLETVHEDSELFSFAILECTNDFEEFANKHDVNYELVDYLFESGETAKSVFLENVTFSNLEEISEHFSISRFIYAKRNHDYQINEVVFENGRTKYIFEMWEKMDGDYIKMSSCDFIKAGESINEGIMFSDNIGIEIPFFEELDHTYDHEFQRDILVDGVKQSTINKIRDVIL